MIFGEFLAVLAAIAGVSIVLRGGWAVLTSSQRKEHQRRADLATALQSRDYRQLEDWLVLHADGASEKMIAHVKQRRDELFIEKNP